jgi:transposase-like protein
MVLSRSRDQKSADRLVKDFASRTVKAPALVFTDEHGAYKKALLSVYGIEYRPRRAAGEQRKRPKKKRAPSGFVHATVKKTRRAGRVAEVSTALSLGKEETLAAALNASPVSNTINTAFIERYNGTACYVACPVSEVVSRRMSGQRT